MSHSERIFLHTAGVIRINQPALLVSPIELFHWNDSLTSCVAVFEFLILRQLSVEVFDSAQQEAQWGLVFFLSFGPVQHIKISLKLQWRFKEKEIVYPEMSPIV